jgi:hypothetical protein
VHLSTRFVVAATSVGLLVASWAVLLVGWLLPWEHSTTHPADITSGWDIDPFDTGSTLGWWVIVWLVISGAALTFALVCLDAGSRRSAFVVLAIPAVAWGSIALYFSVDERNLASDRSSPDYTLRANGGVYVAIVGSAMLLATGLLMLVAAVADRQPSEGETTSPA